MEYTKCNICELPFDEKHNHETCVFKLNQEITRLQSLTRWIPVEEKLPDVKKDTLFLCQFRDAQGNWKVDTKTFWAESHMFSGSRKVEYWQPLPEGVK